MGIGRHITRSVGGSFHRSIPSNKDAQLKVPSVVAPKPAADKAPPICIQQQLNQLEPALLLVGMSESKNIALTNPEHC